MPKHSSSSITCRTAGRLLGDAFRFLSFGFRSRAQLVAENLPHNARDNLRRPRFLDGADFVRFIPSFGASRC